MRANSKLPSVLESTQCHQMSLIGLRILLKHDKDMTKCIMEVPASQTFLLARNEYG